jgi:hypothetical protein
MVKTNARLSLGCAAAVCFLLGSSGCLVEEAQEEAQDGEASQVDWTVAEDLSPTAWSGWVSEELPNLECSSGNLIRGGECSGSYCDNIRVDCSGVAGSFGNAYWTTFFSDEGASNYRKCGPKHWVTGIDCSGSWCDNLSLECTEVTNRDVGSCKWSPWYSEENGAFQAPSGYYVRGIACSGNFCDNLQYYYCELL